LFVLAEVEAVLLVEHPLKPMVEVVEAVVLVISIAMLSQQEILIQ
jgi:hypothetical protein